MHVIVWAFEVRPGYEAEFERVYAEDGDWAQLFQTDPAYRGTELLHDVERRRHYATIDRWDSRAAFDLFKRTNHASYESLDVRCARLRVSERLLGRYEA